MEPVYKWTKEYFIKNQEECRKKLSEGLSLHEKIELRSNLHFKEHNSLVLLNHFMITDIKEELEFYCEKYDVKQSDGSIRTENGKYSDKLNILENESCDDPAQHLSERKVCIISSSPSNNQWIKEFNGVSMNSNKRKIENGEGEKSYLLKVYDSGELKLNELVEVVGFLYTTLNIPTDSMDDDDNKQLPAYTIHAISFKELNHNNPIIIHELDDAMEGQSDEEIRQDLLKLFTQFLFGDELSANYMICHLISTVYSRVNEEALGKFTLNLITQSIPSDIITEYIKKFYNLLEILLPNSMYFPLTIENLNTTTFVPKKDYVTNRLTTGILQLPLSTHILFDETKLENGKLETSGCLSVQDLAELIRTQQLSYDFQFYKIPFKTDIPILIMSEGKSLLPSDFVVPIKPIDGDSIRLINENFAAGIHYMRPKLNLYRRYLTKCRLQKFDIDEKEVKMIESDFVKMREASSSFQVEDLHSLLVLSRLLCTSKMLITLDLDSWETAKKFEFERKYRMERRNANEP